MKLVYNAVLESFNDNSVKEPVLIDVEPDRISIVLENDELTDEQGFTIAATYPRGVVVELRHDGELQVMLYKTEKEEPAIFRLNNKGEMDIVDTGIA